MNTLTCLAICISHPEANETLMRNAATWPIADCHFAGCEHEDAAPMSWPPGTSPILRIGQNGNPYGPTRPLLNRFLRVFQWCATEGRKMGYESFCTFEADVVFVRAVPNVSDKPLGTLAGGNSPGFLGSQYFHPPWLIPAKLMPRIVGYFERMVRAGPDERGFPDRFVGRMGDLHPDVAFQHSGNFSQNTLDRPEYLAAAIEAIKRPDCFAVHGVKSDSQLKALGL